MTHGSTLTPVARTATGSRLAGMVETLGESVTAPKRQAFGAPLVFVAVIVSSRDAPGARVNVAGATVSVAPGGLAAVAVHVTGTEAELVTVRVHVHEVWQFSFAMD